MNPVAGSILTIDEVQLKSAPLNTGLNPFAKVKPLAWLTPIRPPICCLYKPQKRMIWC